jgi:undecaprenyl-diphosphatase
VFYRRKLTALLMGLFKRERASVLYAVWVVISMIPAFALYKIGGDTIDEKFANPKFVAWALCATGLFMIATALVKTRDKDRSGDLSHIKALVMGVAQAVAMLPGVSRSGSTIATARFLGVKPKDAAEFSFIMSIPVIGGAAFLKLLKHHKGITATQSWQYGVGAIVAGIVGFVAIKTFVALLGRGKLWAFGVYCVVAGAAALIFL